MSRALRPPRGEAGVDRCVLGGVEGGLPAFGQVAAADTFMSSSPPIAERSGNKFPINFSRCPLLGPLRRSTLQLGGRSPSISALGHSWHAWQASKQAEKK